jgi:hypothetical protein
MGYSNAAYIAQTASELAYGQLTMIKFLEHKGWKAGGSEWPFLKISEIVIIYLDDLCVKTPIAVENADQIHLNALEFVLFATQVYGFKIGRGKFKPWCKTFKFLGHWFDVTRCTNSIPPERLRAFQTFRSPSSCAETLSRLGVLSYYRKYIPLLQVLVAPLNQMAMSGQFKWEPMHQMAWNCIKFLACLGFKLHVIDKKITNILHL